jgi:hypothetical protein
MKLKKELKDLSVQNDIQISDLTQHQSETEKLRKKYEGEIENMKQQLQKTKSDEIQRKQ